MTLIQCNDVYLYLNGCAPSSHMRIYCIVHIDCFKGAPGNILMLAILFSPVKIFLVIVTLIARLVLTHCGFWVHHSTELHRAHISTYAVDCLLQTNDVSLNNVHSSVVSIVPKLKKHLRTYLLENERWQYTAISAEYCKMQ